MTGNVLIVEDDKEWCEAYIRAADREGIQCVKIAKDLPKATALIDDMQFAVALIDIGLNIGDDQNVDGLLVMKKIRSVSDATSVIVVTGRSGRDVLPITRDAIMKYDAYEIVGKSDIEPQDIRRLLRDGIAAFKDKESNNRVHAHETLRGNTQQLLWDDNVLRATKTNAGVKALYDFMNLLLGAYLPMIPEHEGDGAIIEASGIVHGSYWSRSIGGAIAICFGDLSRSQGAIEEAKRTGSLIGKYQVNSILKEYSRGQLGGAVFYIKDALRTDFGRSL